MALTNPYTRKKILVAAGDRSVMESIQALLARNGYQVIPVLQGAELTRKILAENPDALLLDLALPGMGEAQVQAMLTSNKAIKEIPLGLLGHGNGHKTAQQLGALLVIPTPFKPEQLVSSVGLLVSARRKKPAA